MERPFNQEEIEFLQKIGGTRSGDKWIKLLRNLCDYLSDTRTAPMPTNGDMAQFGAVMLARRTAAKVIEDELIELIKSGDQEVGGEKTSYR